MHLWKEDDFLEQSLQLADESYERAYRYLEAFYRKTPENYGPQTYYFLACFAGGSGNAENALHWLTESIDQNGYWYRPEVLEDDDLSCLAGNPAFLRLCKVSQTRYAVAAQSAASIASRSEKLAENLLLAVHGNTQSAAIARADWMPLVTRSFGWQLETVQSATPDGFGTYRWEYDKTNYLDFAREAESAASAGYRHIAWAGFSAGCDMLLRTLLYTDARCDVILMQSPWLPLLDAEAEPVARAVARKNVQLCIFCGENDADCLPCAEALQQLALAAGAHVCLTIQSGLRHQFPDALADEYTVLP